MRGWVWILLLGSSICAEDEVKSRKHRIDEVNDDYDGKAGNAELSVQEQHRLIHEEAVRKAHEAAVKAAGHDINSENTNTVTSTETVQSVHTEVVDNASGETIKEKLEVTKKVVDSNGDVREDYFVAEMEDEDLQLEEVADDEDPKAAEEPAEKEVQKKSEEDLSDDGSENSGKETAQVQEDEELQKRMEDFSESLGSILTDVVKTQQKLRKELEDDEKEEVSTKIPYKISREGLREIEINGVKVLTADNRKPSDKKENNGVFIEPTKVMREHEVDGIKIMTTVDLENKGNPDLPIDEQDEDWQVYDRNEQLLLRRKRFLAEKQINPTFTGYKSIDALTPTVGKTEDDCRKVWIFNEKPFLTKCIKEFSSELRPWCSLDEVFQGNFVFCEETEEERLEREKHVESLNLFNEGMSAIGGWDSRRAVVKAGFEKIEQAYELGYLKASGHLAWAKLNGYFLKMNVQEAKELALGGAERGQALDQAVLGFMYATGVGFPANQAKAFLYWSFAANSGIMSADMALGFRYTKGVGVAYNCEAAMIHYQRAAGKVMNSISYSGGNAKAKWNLEQLNSATFDESGLHDINLINYYELLANQGEVEAMVKLGEMFVDRAYERDYQRAADLYRNAAKSLPVASARLGRLYLDGRGVPKDYRTGYEYLKSAADRKSAMGQTYLGVLFEEGTYPHLAIKDKVDPSITGVPRYDEAIKYYKLAVEQGFPEACYRLAMMQLEGRGTKPDIRSAVKNLQIAAQHQNIKAIYQLAVMQSSGRGIPRNCPAAVDMFKNVAERGIYARLFMHAGQQFKSENCQSSYVIYANLAEMGFSIAQANVAELLENGEITITGEQSPYPRALASFQRAALQGIVSARVKVGDYYFYGQGTAVDEKLAGDNYREAAESHGNGQAFFNLGWMHHHGVGLDKDMHLAKRFYDQAIEVSPEDATLPATLAIIELYFGGYAYDLLSSLGKVTLSSVSDNTIELVDIYVGENWDVYLGLFLALLLFFVINFRRQ